MSNPNPKIDHLTPWKPGQSGNEAGRPRKMVSQVLKDLEGAGIENVTKQQVIGCIETLLNCTQDDLESYARDKGHSVLIRMVARHLLKSGDNEKILSMLLDRAFGKPDIKTEHSGEVKILKWDEEEGDPAEYIQQTLNR